MAKQSKHKTKAIKTNTANIKTTEIKATHEKLPQIIFLIALITRVIYIISSQNNPFFSVPIVDMQYNWGFSGEILTKGFFGVSSNLTTWKPVFYPCFLALIRFFSANNILIAQVFQSILGAANCTILYFLAKKYFSRRVSFIAGILMAFYGPFVFYDTAFLPVTLDTFFALCLLLFISSSYLETKATKWFIPGIFLALASNTHQTILIYTAAIPVICYFWYRQTALRNRTVLNKIFPVIIKRLVYFLLGFLLIIAPLVLNNYLKSQNLSIVSSNGGVNFYIGNNQKADGVSAPPLGLAWLRLINEPTFNSQNFNVQDNPSTYFYQKAFAYIIKNPLSFAGLYVKKLLYLYSGVEIKNNVDMYHYGEYSPLLKGLLWASPLLAFPFGLLFPLAVIGIILSYRKNSPEFLHFYLYLMMISSGVALFFICARYRMILIPVLLLFAAYSIDFLITAIKNKKLELKHGYLFGLLIALLIFSNFNNRYLLQVNADQEFLDFQQLAKNQFSINHQLNLAETSIKKAIRLNPEYVDSYYIMGGIQREKGDLNQSLKYLNLAMKKDPRYQEAREIIAEIEIQKGEYKQAEAELINILFKEEDWYDYKSPTNASQLLGNLYYQIYKEQAKAACFYERYLQFNPSVNLKENVNLPNIKKFLASYRERDYSLMLNYWQNIIAKDPKNQIAHLRIAEIYYKLEKFEQAEKELAQIDLRNSSIRNSLITLYISLVNLYNMTGTDSSKANYFYDLYTATRAEK